MRSSYEQELQRIIVPPPADSSSNNSRRGSPASSRLSHTGMSPRNDVIPRRPSSNTTRRNDEAIATGEGGGGKGSILPMLVTPLPPSASQPSPSPRIQSPNTLKRVVWTTPRTAEEEVKYYDNGYIVHNDEEVEEATDAYHRGPEAPLSSTDHRTRRWMPTYSSGSRSDEQDQMVYMEQMYNTLQMLNLELDKERQDRTQRQATISIDDQVPTALGQTTLDDWQLSGPFNFDDHKTNFAVASTPSTATSDYPTMRPRPHQPQSKRSQLPKHSIPLPKDQLELCAALGKNAELRIRSREIERNAEKASLELEQAQKQMKLAERRISNREEKLRQLLKEKLHWQKDLKDMRDQVVEEKMRQVELLRRLESVKRDCNAQVDGMKQTVCDAQKENEALRAYIAEMEDQIVFQTKKMDALVRQTNEERKKMASYIAETQVKFKEWKDGKAIALKHAQNIAVNDIKTEFDLKIARHQEEKEKLRSKVKDLEASLRLIQKDRTLSPLELSLQKATALNSKYTTGTIEVELIEARSRIRELETLLEHSHEHQKCQENIIQVSETKTSRLIEARESASLGCMNSHQYAEKTAHLSTTVYDSTNTHDVHDWETTTNLENEYTVSSALAPVTNEVATKVTTHRLETADYTTDQELVGPSQISSNELLLMQEVERLQKELASANAQCEYFAAKEAINHEKGKEFDQRDKMSRTENGTEWKQHKDVKGVVSVDQTSSCTDDNSSDVIDRDRAYVEPFASSAGNAVLSIGPIYDPMDVTSDSTEPTYLQEKREYDNDLTERAYQSLDIEYPTESSRNGPDFVSEPGETVEDFQEDDNDTSTIVTHAKDLPGVSCFHRDTLFEKQAEMDFAFCEESAESTPYTVWPCGNHDVKSCAMIAAEASIHDRASEEPAQNEFTESYSGRSNIPNENGDIISSDNGISDSSMHLHKYVPASKDTSDYRQMENQYSESKEVLNIPKVSIAEAPMKEVIFGEQNSMLPVSSNSDDLSELSANIMDKIYETTKSGKDTTNLSFYTTLDVKIAAIAFVSVTSSIALGTVITNVLNERLALPQCQSNLATFALVNPDKKNDHQVDGIVDLLESTNVKLVAETEQVSPQVQAIPIELPEDASKCRTNSADFEAACRVATEPVHELLQSLVSPVESGYENLMDKAAVDTYKQIVVFVNRLVHTTLSSIIERTCKLHQESSDIPTAISVVDKCGVNQCVPVDELSDSEGSYGDPRSDNTATFVKEFVNAIEMEAIRHAVSNYVEDTNRLCSQSLNIKPRKVDSQEPSPTHGDVNEEFQKRDETINSLKTLLDGVHCDSVPSFLQQHNANESQEFITIEAPCHDATPMELQALANIEKSSWLSHNGSAESDVMPQEKITDSTSLSCVETCPNTESIAATMVFKLASQLVADAIIAGVATVESSQRINLTQELVGNAHGRADSNRCHHDKFIARSSDDAQLSSNASVSNLHPVKLSKSALTDTFPQMKVEVVAAAFVTAHIFVATILNGTLQSTGEFSTCTQTVDVTIGTVPDKLVPIEQPTVDDKTGSALSNVCFSMEKTTSKKDLVIIESNALPSTSNLVSSCSGDVNLQECLSILRSENVDTECTVLADVTAPVNNDVLAILEDMCAMVQAATFDCKVVLGQTVTGSTCVHQVLASSVSPFEQEPLSDSMQDIDVEPRNAATDTSVDTQDLSTNEVFEIGQNMRVESETTSEQAFVVKDDFGKQCIYIASLDTSIAVTLAAQTETDQAYQSSPWDGSTDEGTGDLTQIANMEIDHVSTLDTSDEYVLVSIADMANSKSEEISMDNLSVGTDTRAPVVIASNELKSSVFIEHPRVSPKDEGILACGTESSNAMMIDECTHLSYNVSTTQCEELTATTLESLEPDEDVLSVMESILVGVDTSVSIECVKYEEPLLPTTNLSERLTSEIVACSIHDISSNIDTAVGELAITNACDLDANLSAEFSTRRLAEGAIADLTFNDTDTERVLSSRIPEQLKSWTEATLYEPCSQSVNEHVQAIIEEILDLLTSQEGCIFRNGVGDMSSDKASEVCGQGHSLSENTLTDDVSKPRALDERKLLRDRTGTKRHAAKRRASRRGMEPSRYASDIMRNPTLMAYDAKHDHAQPFDLLDISILTVDPEAKHIQFDEHDRLPLTETEIIAKRKKMDYDNHRKSIVNRMMPAFNYAPVLVKFQWSDFVVATPITFETAPNVSALSGPVQRMRQVLKKGMKLACGSYVIVSAFIRPLEDGNETLRVQIYDSEWLDEFQFDFFEDHLKDYMLEWQGRDDEAREFVARLEFRREQERIIIKLPDKLDEEQRLASSIALKSQSHTLTMALPNGAEPHYHLSPHRPHAHRHTASHQHNYAL